MPKVISGLDRLLQENTLRTSVSGNIGLLCHAASVDKDLNHSLIVLQKMFGGRLKAVFGPQHGFVADLQDNMIESDHYQHPYFKLPIYSLYSETRSPTAKMLEGIDTVIVDLQDVGTRIYTYIYTLTMLMKVCGQQNKKVVVLDRPNPIGGEQVEGNVLDPEFSSFVGMHPIPFRHGLTIGEVAKMANSYWGMKCDLEVIPMIGWERSMDFEDTGLPWVMPSPNLPNIDTAFIYPATVIFEGTNISEGRGTTRPLEVLGHPKLEPFSFVEKTAPILKAAALEGFTLRPTQFVPTFQKHQGIPCGGFQIHITDRAKLRPWRLGQVLCREFYRQLGNEFRWNEPPYEYEYELLPIDILNGGDSLRKWVESDRPVEELDRIEAGKMQKYNTERNDIKIY